MNKYGFFLLALCWVLPSSADNSEEVLLSQVAQRLQLQEQLQGNFMQQKKLPFLTLPLRSSGHFSLTAESGLRWQVQEPLVSTMTVQNDRVLLDGEPVQDRGVGQLIASLMAGFMSGDFNGLQQNFAITGELQEEGWQLQLQPEGLMLSRVLETISASGDQYLQRVEIVQSDQTRTSIEFSELRGGAAGKSSTGAP